MTKEDRVHPKNDFRNEYNPYISTDDQVYKGGIVAYTRNQKDRASLAMPHNDRALWHLINLGAQDMPAIDKPWDESMCAMRFSTCLADCLWVMLDREYARVQLLLTLLDGVDSNRFLERSFRGAGPHSGEGSGEGGDQCRCSI